MLHFDAEEMKFPKYNHKSSRIPFRHQHIASFPKDNNLALSYLCYGQIMYRVPKMYVCVTPHLQIYLWLFVPYELHFPDVYLKYRILQTLENCKTHFSYN